MAEHTSNYNLKKPSDDDFYNVQDFNDNADVVDKELKKQSDRIAKTEVPDFTEAKTDENIQSGESLSALLGKIKRAISKLFEHIQSGNPHSESAAKNHKHSASDITSGILPITRGGTGATTAVDARAKLEITPKNIGAVAERTFKGEQELVREMFNNVAELLSPLPTSNGGTGATTAAQALENLGISSGTKNIKIGNLMIQWGTYRATAEDESAQIVFDENFASAPEVFVNIRTSAPTKKFASASEQTKSFFWLYYHSNDTSHTATISWMAIGKI